MTFNFIGEKMHKILQEICDLLEQISDQMLAQNKEEKTRANEIWSSWLLPPISPYALAMIPTDIKEALVKGAIEDLGSDFWEWNATEALDTLKSMRTNLIPNMYSSPTQGLPLYLNTITYVQNLLAPMLGWVTPSSTALPSNLVRNLNKVERDLKNLMPDKAEMEDRIQTIREAHEAAALLPTTVQELKEKQRDISTISTTASELLGKITVYQEQAENNLKTIIAKVADASSSANQAAEAHRISTTVGLAAAFDSQATKLRRSMTWWVAGLCAALIALMAVGHFRLSILKDAFNATPFEPSRVWIQVILSLLSVGAPLWFAWLATKQISQRFRLTEDYAFKAAVSKAYEGYRREAKNIDPLFERALFASALKRLDEAPLRLVETATHGSPLHEFAESTFVKDITSAATQLVAKSKAAVTKADKTTDSQVNTET